MCIFLVSFISCDVPMRLIYDRSAIDGVLFRCPRCRRKKYLRHGTFFARSHLSLKVLVGLQVVALRLVSSWSSEGCGEDSDSVTGCSVDEKSQWDRFIKHTHPYFGRTGICANSHAGGLIHQCNLVCVLFEIRKKHHLLPCCKHCVCRNAFVFMQNQFQ